MPRSLPYPALPPRLLPGENGGIDAAWTEALSRAFDGVKAEPSEEQQAEPSEEQPIESQVYEDSCPPVESQVDGQMGCDSFFWEG